MNKWVEKWFPPFYEPPEGGCVVRGVFYSFFCLISFPFVLLLFMKGSYNNRDVITWCEIVYHTVNFAASIHIFCHYLQDSFLQVRTEAKQIFKSVMVCALVAVILAMEIGRNVKDAGSGVVQLAIFGMLPIVEMEMFALPVDLLQNNPLFGVICMVVFTPVTVSCLYYGSIFAPICRYKPWLAYLITAVFIAIPRICNGATNWIMKEELVLYFCHLPLHMLGCWCFQKNGTIWAPIFLHMVANLVGCAGWLVMLGIHG